MTSSPCGTMNNRYAASGRIKIAYAIYDYVKLGGPERYVRELSTRFAAEGHEVHIFTAHPPIGNSGPIVFHTVRMPRFLPHCIRLLLFSRKVRRALEPYDFDIIHSQGPDCLVHNVITVHFCYRAWYELTRRLTLFEFLIKCIRPMYRVCLAHDRINFAHCRSVIAVSGKVRQELRQYHHVPQERIALVYNGVDFDEFAPENRAKWRRIVRSRLKINGDAFVISFVSGESIRKGLSTILRALRLLNNDAVQLLVVGHVIRLPYIILAKLLGVRNRMVFIPPSKNVARYYAASDLYLFPTKYDTFGMAVAEAMASELPVLVSRTAGIAELIKDPVYLLKDHLDARQIRESVKQFIDTGGVQAGRRQSLRAMVAACTWERTASETMLVYRDTIGQHKRDARLPDALPA